MPDISTYAELVQTLLGEGAKYFVVLLFAVLAIRFWKNALRISVGARTKAYAFATLASVLACGAGYVSFRHSMGRLYAYYGMQAFQAQNLDSALTLFQTSLQYWENPDVLGEKGVCALLLNQPEVGKQLLEEAKDKRKGKVPPFEEFHEGLYYFITGKWDAAIPLLESSSRDTQYEWKVTKMLCVIALETNDVPTATRLMKPFGSVAIQEEDHAYIMASLNLAGGRTNDARAIVDKFYGPDCSPFLKGRFEKLRGRMQN